jgi:hypothetical protein
MKTEMEIREKFKQIYDGEFDEDLHYDRSKFEYSKRRVLAILVWVLEK